MREWRSRGPKLNDPLGAHCLRTGDGDPEGLFRERAGVGKPLVSIVTVVRNGERYLEQTIQSVLNQSYENIEYIVVDGDSSDGTLDIIRGFEDRIAHWMSEPDQGIYDAMNKGSRIASGDYALYLNAGDYLYQDDSVEECLRLSLESGEPPLLIVGKVMYALGNNLFLDWIYPVSEGQIHRYNPPHQATLIGSPIYKRVFYNPALKMRGDYDFWARLRFNGLFKPTYVENIVSVFRLGGVSNNAKNERLKCIETVISRYVCLGDFSMRDLMIDLTRAEIKRGLMRFLGERLYYRYILYNAYRLRKKLLQ